MSDLKSRIETAGDMRKFLAGVALTVARGDMKVQEAACAIKACEQINASIYSEAKIAAMQLAAGHKAPEMGALPLYK